MTPSDIVDMCREALMIGLFVSAPVLITGVVVGLMIGLLQALTQIQEQTINFVPKLVAMAVALALTLPWIITRFTEYVQDLITDIPNAL